MSRRSLGDDGFAWPVSDADLDAFEVLPVSGDGVARAPRAGTRVRTPPRRPSAPARRRKKGTSPPSPPAPSAVTAEAPRAESFLTRTRACASSIGLLDVVPVPIDKCAPLQSLGTPSGRRTLPADVNLERPALVVTGMVLGVLLALVVSAARDRSPAAGSGDGEVLERPIVTSATSAPSAPAPARSAVAVRALGPVGPPFVPHTSVASPPGAGRAVVESPAGSPAPPAAAGGGVVAGTAGAAPEVAVRPSTSATQAAREPVGSATDSRSAVVPRTASVVSAPARAPSPRRTTRAAAVVRPPTPPAAFEAVRRYAQAYARMDARAVQAVWPSADRDELVTTFTSLREQRLTLSRCQGKAAEVGAVVTCRGTLRYRPRLGDHSTRVERGVWSFELRQADDAWRIADVTAP